MRRWWGFDTPAKADEPQLTAAVPGIERLRGWRRAPSGDPMATELPVHLKRFSANPISRGIRNRRPNAELRALVDKPAFRIALRQLGTAGLSLNVSIGSPADLETVARSAKNSSWPIPWPPTAGPRAEPGACALRRAARRP
jgi:hypothetical protein